MKSQARKELELYFGTKRELEEKLDRGDIDNLHYEIKKNHLIKVLVDRSYIASRAFYIASMMVGEACLLTRNQEISLSHLGRCDIEARKAWGKKFFLQNIESASYRILDTLEAIEIPAIPEPSPEMVQKAQDAWNHQLTAKELKRSMSVDCMSPCGGGGAGGQSGSRAGAVIGGNGGGHWDHDPKDPT